MVHVPTMRCAASVRQAYCRGRTISRRGIARACCLLIDGYRLRNHKCRVAAPSLWPRHRNNRRSGEKDGGLEPAIAAPRPRQRAHAADDRAPGISSGQASNRAASLFGSSGWLPSVDGIAVMSRVPRGALSDLEPCLCRRGEGSSGRGRQLEFAAAAAGAHPPNPLRAHGSGRSA